MTPQGQDGIAPAMSPDRGAGAPGLPRIRRGTAAFRNANWALFAAGFSTFSLLYCAQPLLPQFSAHFGVSPAQSSLALSLTTGLLACSILAVGIWSHRFPRKAIMTASMFASAFLTVAAGWMPDWIALLAMRALEGIALGGVPAIAMAYLAEEIDGADLGYAMGLYIGGSAYGGMAGRIICGVAADHADWRYALTAIGALGLLSAIVFARSLPPSRHFTPQRGGGWRVARQGFVIHLRDARMLCLYGTGFLVMGSFVSLYNYIGFRLALPPYSLGQTVISAVFLAYAVGGVASAFFGRMADRHGRRVILCLGIAIMLAGILLTLGMALPWIVAGVLVTTIGFFAAHSVASAWVGQLARQYKGQATSLYLLSYYLGSSIVGSVGGTCWEHGGWAGVVAMVAATLLLAAVLAVRLYTAMPPHAARS
jgi:YNFM family putative membrane transporter